MKKILITNDDGFDASGILALKEALSVIGEVWCVAPAREKSACGHGLNITSPMRIIEVAPRFYKVDDGSPTDCIYLAMGVFFKNIKPDIVVSGINIGTNLGEDITYSGTVAGAIEGAIYDIPAIAISQRVRSRNKKHFDFDLATKVIQDLVTRVFDGGFPLSGRKLLNVNIPSIDPAKCKGYKITQIGYRNYMPINHSHIDPRGVSYHWIGQQALDFTNRNSSDKDATIKIINDFEALNEGYVSITPLLINQTSYQDLGKIKDWIK